MQRATDAWAARPEHRGAHRAGVVARQQRVTRPPATHPASALSADAGASCTVVLCRRRADFLVCQ
eukprot:48722-Prymnesium_polylepis.1